MSDGRGPHARRRKLAARDGMICWLCDKPIASLGKIHCSVDHITPRSLGGTDALANLKLAHPICNKVRGNVADPAESRTRVAEYRAKSSERTARNKRRHANAKIRKMTFEERLAMQKQDEDRDVFGPDRYAG